MSSAPPQGHDRTSSCLHTATVDEFLNRTGGEFCGNSKNTITFRHPGYSDDFQQNVLFRVQASDKADGGFHHGTARAACAILSGNAIHGYLKTKRDGPRVDLGDDEVLREKNYYFCVDSDINLKYPVFRSFDDWTYPHDKLPKAWADMMESSEEDSGDDLAPPSASNLTSSVLRRDECCRLSMDKDYIEAAHLCPRSAALWFHSNGMEQYNQNTSLAGAFAIDDIANCIALRPDIHKAFDDGKFVIVPKQGQWVAQFLGRTSTMGRQFHNLIVNLNKSISSAFLFARFAYTVFIYARNFFDAGVPREVIIRVVEDGQHKERHTTVTAAELISMAGARSRSLSPRKRKAAAGDEAEEFEVKRMRVWRSDVEIQTQEPKGQERTPSLPDIIREDTHAQPATGSMPPRMVDKRQYLLEERNRNQNVWCCDLNAADEAAEAGALKDSVVGGGYLCRECLGMEYVDIEGLEHDGSDSGIYLAKEHITSAIFPRPGSHGSTGLYPVLS